MRGSSGSVPLYSQPWREDFFGTWWLPDSQEDCCYPAHQHCFINTCFCHLSSKLSSPSSVGQPDHLGKVSFLQAIFFHSCKILYWQNPVCYSFPQKQIRLSSCPVYCIISLSRLPILQQFLQLTCGGLSPNPADIAQFSGQYGHPGM